MRSRLQDIIAGRGPIRKIGVIGMGYVGIPSAVLFADSPAFDFVWGFQRDSPSSGYKIDMLNAGVCPLEGDEPGLEPLLRKVVSEKKFRCTSDFSEISGVDAVTIAIQTPFLNSRDLEPDLSPLMAGVRMAGRHLTEGTLVVLESTVTPGTTGGIVREALEEESGMRAGEEFALAHAPERVMVGRLLRNIREHDRIIGGIDEVSTERATGLYSPVLTSGRIIPMTAVAAEVTKTAENTFRDLQIAAVNQLALYCEAMGVNVYDVRAGIDSLKGEGVTRAVLYPGAGVGGHCLTKDTYHLERGARVMGADLDYPEEMDSLFVLARNINDFMPCHMFNLTRVGLERLGSPLSSSKVVILGWAFIRDSGDARNSPAELYRDMMLEAGAEVHVHDPYVPATPALQVSRDLGEVLPGADAVAVFTAHRIYGTLTAAGMKAVIGKEHPVVVDGRGVIDADEYIREGFIYKGVGRGDRNRHPIVE